MTVKLSNKYFFKYSILFILLFCSFINTVNAQKNLGIGTEKPDPKAVLELNVENPSINPQGLLLPRLTDTQGTLLGSMLNASHKGMAAYNTTNNTFYIWDGTQWKSTGSVLNSIVGLGGIVISTSGNSFTVDGNNLKSQWISASSNQIYTNSFVGIGTNNPSYSLQVQSPNSRVALFKTTNGADRSTAFEIQNQSGSAGWVVAVGGIGNALGLTNEQLYFQNEIGVPRDFIVLPNGGNVGIGTTTPVAPLHIVGSGAVLQRPTDSPGDNAEIEFEDAANNDFNRWRVGIRPSDQNDNFNIANWVSGDHNIRMYIDPLTGNVGIGNPNGPNTTPPVPAYNFVVSGTASVTETAYFGTIVGNNLAGAGGSIVTVDGLGKLGIGTISSFWTPFTSWGTVSGIAYSGPVFTQKLQPTIPNTTVTAALMDDMYNEYYLGRSGLIENSDGDFYLRSYWGINLDRHGGNTGVGASPNGAFGDNGTFAIRYRTDPNTFRTDMLINADGLVGIGTTTPNQQLTVQGNSSTTGIGYFGTIIGNNLTGATGSIVTVDGVGRLGFGTLPVATPSQWLSTSAGIYYITSVGIGMLPLAGNSLNVKSSGNSTKPIRVEYSGTTFPIFEVDQGSGGQGNLMMYDNAGVKVLQLGVATSSYFNGSGNFGIGTITPNEKLTVQGNTSATGIGYFGTLVGNNMNGAAVGSVVTVDGTGKLGFGNVLTSNQWLTTASGIYYSTSVGIGMLPNSNQPLALKSTSNGSTILGLVGATTTSNIITFAEEGGNGVIRLSNNVGVSRTQITPFGNTYFLDNVGIGAQNPPNTAYKLLVKGNTSISGGTLAVETLTSGGVNLVSALADGTLTVTGQTITSSQWITTTSGIYTTSNVGIGFAGNPTQGKFVVVEDAANNPGIFVSGGGPLKSVNIQLGRNNSPDGGIGIAGAVGSFSGIAVAGDMVVRSEFNHLILSAKNAGGDIKFATGATDTEKMRITNLGNVGIGIVNPSAKLDIKDVDVSNSAYDGVRFDLAQGGNSGLKNGLLLNYSVSGTVSATNRGITTNVVGTSSASGGVTGNVINMNVSGTGTVNGLAVSVPSNSTGNKTGAFIQVSGTGGSQNIGLNVNVLGATTNYAAILNGGNVGIGTSTPNQQLAVVGNSSVSGTGYFGTLIGNNLSGASGSVVTVDGTGKLGLGTLVQGNNYWEPNGTNKIYTNSFVGIGESNPLVPLSIKSTDSNLPSVLKITRDVTTGTGAQIGIDVAFTGSQVSGSKIGYNVKVTNPANESVRGMSSEIEQNNTTATGVLIASYSYINNNGPTQSLAFRAENGGSGVGNHMGFSAFDNSTGNGERFGLHSEMIGTGAAANNYAIYGKATGAGLNNYAGYFADGKVYIENNVGIGTTNPTAKLDIIGTLRFRNFTNGILTVDGTGLIGVGTMPSASNWLSTTVGVTFTNDKIAIGTSTVAGAARFKVAGDGSMGGMVITSQSLVNPISTSNTIYTTLITVPVYIPQGTNTIEFNVIGSSQGGGNIDFQLDVSGNTSAPISMTNTTPTIGTTPQTVSVASVNGWQTIKINVANSAGNTSAILHGYTVIVKN